MIEITERASGRKFDVAENTQVASTYQALDLVAPARLFAARSTSFDLPDTPNNAEIFEHVNIIGSSSTKAYQSIPVLATQNGLPVFDNAFLVFLSYAKGQGYNVVLFDNTLDFFETLGDKTVSELAALDTTRTYSAAAIAAATNNTWPDIITYPLADYGTGAFLPSVQILGELYPAYFKRFLFEKIIEEAGYNYTGLDSADLALLDRILLPFTNDRFLPFDDDAETFAEDYSIRAGLSAFTTRTLSTSSFINIPFTSATPPDFYNSNNTNWNVVDNRYQNAEVGKLTLNVSFVIRWNRNSDDPQQTRISAELCRDRGGNITIFEDISELITAGPKTVSFPEVSIVPEANDIFFARIQMTASGVSTSFTFSSSPEHFFQADAAFLNGGGTINLKDNAPNIKQIDLFKDVCALLGKTVRIVGDEIQFFTLQQVRDSSAEIDWSDKVEVDSERKSILPNGFGRLSQLIWNGTNDDVNRDLNRQPDSIDFVLPQSYLPPTATVHRLAARQAYRTLDILSSQRVYFGNFTLEENNTDVFNTPRATRKRRINGVLYVLNGTSGQTRPITVVNLTSLLNSSSPTMRVAQLLSLETDIAPRYDYYEEVLQSYEEVSFVLNLSTLDVLNFNPSIPVRIGAQRFFLQKIEQFIDDTKPVRVQMIRL